MNRKPGPNRQPTKPAADQRPEWSPPAQVASARVQRRNSGPTESAAARPVPSTAATALPVTAEAPTPATPRSWSQRIARPFLRLGQSWAFWVLLSILITTGSGAFALAVLLRLPGLPNCPAVFWPLASASMRFECARLAASKQTMKDLLEAIALLDSLPPDHEMRGEADRLIELWSQDVLNLAEEAFNAGKLDDAIQAARKIPAKATAAKLVKERIDRWKSIWSKAEGLYRKAEEQLRDLNWRKAFEFAVRLLDVDNKFWQTTKYEELNNRINTAREDGNKLYKAERLADAGGVENLLAAVKLAGEISKTSYVYQAAQKAILKFGKQMLELAQDALDRQDLQTALRILDQVPDKENLQDQAKDMTILANAQSQAWQNSAAGLEEAISQAQRIEAKRPLYAKAQQLIARWRLEIEGVAQLEKARTLAQSGAIDDLTAAIAQAAQVAANNPRRAEAEKDIQTWTSQIQTIQDRPILDQADQLAGPGDVGALQAAINRASQLGQGRALSREAQTKIAEWTAAIQRIQDQPILDQARNLANAGNLQAAIATAGQIRGGALYGEAQDAIEGWRKQIQTAVDRATGERSLQEAKQLANTGTPEALVAAIQRAEQVPADSGYQAEAAAAINQWSWQLLQIAQGRASAADVNGAIAIAQQIPSGTDAHAQAQQLIETWQKLTGKQ